jgi:hypothetical protein
MYERTLSATHLREYLKRLPDFEDFDAEQKAFGIAAAHIDTLRALSFFIGWPALDRADALVKARGTEMDGKAYDFVRPAAEALEGKYPDAAMLLYRRLVDSVLERASFKHYQYAARDLLSCERIASRISDAIESHAAYMDRLKSLHARKTGFWSAVKR